VLVYGYLRALAGAAIGRSVLAPDHEMRVNLWLIIAECDVSNQRDQLYRLRARLRPRISIAPS
jgi:hypothetical protein